MPQQLLTRGRLRKNGYSAIVKKKRSKSVVPAKKLTDSEMLAVLPSTVVSPDSKKDPMSVFSEPMEWDEVRKTAAKLYGRGFKRPQIARALIEWLVPPESAARTDEQKMSQARAKLRRWEMSKEFRDMVYEHAIVDLDMSTPQILVGLSKRARRGRVDAARLALELTGRHSKEDSSGPVAVTINLANVARPE